jgi:hypothetical protein
VLTLLGEDDAVAPLLEDVPPLLSDDELLSDEDESEPLLSDVPLLPSDALLLGACVVEDAFAISAGS